MENKTSSYKLFLSVVIPVYNEVKRLHNISHVLKYLEKQSFNWEAIVVNDGSIDDTLKDLQQIKKNAKIKIISYTPNRGKGYALKEGVLASNGDFVLIMDVDLSTPLTELKNFLPFLKKFDVCIGTRKVGESTLLKRQPFIREFMGRGFTFLSRLLLGVKLSDFTCGFKCFSKKAAKSIFSKLTIERWGYDSEAMFIAVKQGYSIKEIPVIWRNDSLTKVNLIKDSIRSFSELIKIRINNLSGRYL